MKHFNLKNFAYLTLTFIVSTIVGILTHEGGHIAVAKYYGYETTLHYASMNWQKPWKQDFDSMQAIYSRNQVDEDRRIRHLESERQDSLAIKVKKQYSSLDYKAKSRWISIGGPAQTLLTSLLGIVILLYRRKSILEHGMKLWDWFAVFLSLFSLRFVANMTLSVLYEFINPNGTYFGGDEARIARSLNLPKGSIAFPLFCIGLLIALWVIFKVLPYKTRFTFILSGLTGGVLGWIIWMDWLGPIVLP